MENCVFKFVTFYELYHYLQLKNDSMKNILFLILTITLFSCKSDKQNKEKEFIDSPIQNDSIVVIDPEDLKKTTIDTIEVSN